MNASIRKKYLRCRTAIDLSRLEESRLKEDLDRYINLAKALSVNDAVVVNRQHFLLDPKVRLKCRVPLCRHYGACLNCPPHTSDVEENQKAIDRYQTGILLRWEFPRQAVQQNLSDMRRSIFETISAIESAAFYDGYYFACGFATGSCQSGLCNNTECQALTTPAKGCRHPLLARPSMEAVGFDVFGMAISAGWTVFPAGKKCPSEIESLNRFGIVLIA